MPTESLWTCEGKGTCRRRNPRQREFSIQLRAFDSDKSGSAVGIGVMLALCLSLLQKISSRRQLKDLPDDLAAKIAIHYDLDPRDALIKALAVS